MALHDRTRRERDEPDEDQRRHLDPAAGTGSWLCLFGGDEVVEDDRVAEREHDEAAGRVAVGAGEHDRIAGSAPGSVAWILRVPTIVLISVGCTRRYGSATIATANRTRCVSPPESFYDTETVPGSVRGATRASRGRAGSRSSRRRARRPAASRPPSRARGRGATSRRPRRSRCRRSPRGRPPRAARA